MLAQTLSFPKLCVLTTLPVDVDNKILEDIFGANKIVSWSQIRRCCVFYKQDWTLKSKNTCVFLNKIVSCSQIRHVFSYTNKIVSCSQIRHVFSYTNKIVSWIDITP
jgi:hypothetical protein